MIPTTCRRSCSLALLALAAACCLPEIHAAKGIKADKRELIEEMLADGADAKTPKRKDAANAKSGPANSAENDARALTKIRERLAVSEDDEWAVIAERVTRVETLRKALATGGNGARTATPNDKNKRGARPAGSASPEMDALRAAVGDQYPDAEIKARLARAHEIYQQKEADLRRAQAELRAVLTIRQEAIAVMHGLLPP